MRLALAAVVLAALPVLIAPFLLMESLGLFNERSFGLTFVYASSEWESIAGEVLFWSGLVLPIVVAILAVWFSRLLGPVGVVVTAVVLTLDVLVPLVLPGGASHSWLDVACHALALVPLVLLWRRPAVVPQPALWPGLAWVTAFLAVLLSPFVAQLRSGGWSSLDGIIWLCAESLFFWPVIIAVTAAVCHRRGGWPARLTVFVVTVGLVIPGFAGDLEALPYAMAAVLMVGALVRVRIPRRVPPVVALAGVGVMILLVMTYFAP